MERVTKKKDETHTHRYEPLSGIVAKEDGKAESRREGRSAREIMVDI